MTEDDSDLRALLETLDPKARDDLRRVLIRDKADRNARRPSQVSPLIHPWR
jgi:hypothetical protein